MLLDAFERVVMAEVSRLALVSGYSGIGKSSVVNVLQKASSYRAEFSLLGNSINTGGTFRTPRWRRLSRR